MAALQRQPTSILAHREGTGASAGLPGRHVHINTPPDVTISPVEDGEVDKDSRLSPSGRPFFVRQWQSGPALAVHEDDHTDEGRTCNKPRRKTEEFEPVKEFWQEFSGENVCTRDETCLGSVTDVFVWPVRWYIENPLRLSVYFLTADKFRTVRYVVALVAAALCLLIVAVAVHGMLHLVDEPRDLQTLQAIERQPVMPVFIAVVTHIVLAFYAKSQHAMFKKKIAPPAPALYVFILGKLFTVTRMLMAYSSNELGTTLNFFLYEECILIVVHITFSIFVLSRFSHHPMDLDAISKTVWSVLAVDIFKTLCTAALFLNFSRGEIANFFDRLPDQFTQVCTFLAVHVVLDCMQSTATAFSLHIARACSKHTNEDEERERRVREEAQARADQEAVRLLSLQTVKRLYPERLPRTTSGHLSPSQRHPEGDVAVFRRDTHDWIESVVIFNTLLMDGFWYHHLFNCDDFRGPVQKSVVEYIGRLMHVHGQEDSKRLACSRTRIAVVCLFFFFLGVSYTVAKHVGL